MKRKKIEEMTKAELIAYAKAKSVVLPASATKAQIIALIPLEAAPSAEPPAEAPAATEPTTEPPVAGVKVKCQNCGFEFESKDKPEDIVCPQCNSTNCRRDFSTPGLPRVSPRLGNMPAKPKTLRVCGNTVPVIDGKAREADPKVLRRRARAAAKKRGEQEGETRI